MNRETTQAAATSPLLGRGEPSEALPCSSSSSASAATFPLVLSTFIALWGSYIFGNALGYSSPAESGIIEDLGLSLAEYSLFGSILSIGAIVGALLSGRIADFVGRRGAMWVSDVICIFGWLLIGFAQDALWLDCGRALLGCGIGLLTYAFLGLLFIPESPRWLVKNGRDMAFEASLQQLRGKNVDISQEASEIRDYTIYLEWVTQKGFLDMFQQKYARCLIVGIGLMVFQQFGGMKGVLFYTASIFESAGFPSREGTVLAGITKFSAAGAWLGALITALSFLFCDIHLWKELSSVSFLVGISVFIGAYELGLGSIPWIIMSEGFSSFIHAYVAWPSCLSQNLYRRQGDEHWKKYKSRLQNKKGNETNWCCLQFAESRL
ncbi:hypothetical protein CRG98_001399 [Punica granatum]|uniref:Major facilitator superfamily (MFS) profile domain-containing protein n=1 Tax=Punica granatum TaxID=22663 RepID=A0A2I0LC20_PUNGR|nr:hypothetical protein CRG98_001399 [Punica granatum]